MAIRTIIGIASNDSGAAVAAAEAAIGKQFGAKRRNQEMTTVVPSSQDNADRNNGLWVFRNSNVETGNPAVPIYGGWAGIAAGNADSYLAGCANAILASPFNALRPLLWSLHHEQRVNSGPQCGVGCNGTAADYKAMFRYIVNYMRAAGVADRIKFCFVPGIGQYRNNDNVAGVSVLDPGPEYVDLYGVDIYTMTTLTATQAGLDLVGNYAADRGKFAMSGEFGIQANTQQAADNLQSALDLFVQQGNWFTVCTDTDTCGSLMIPVWQGAAADTAHFAWKGDVTSWPTGGGGVGTATPVVSSFAPTSGPAGTQVVIQGSNFAGTTLVRFNNTSAVFSIQSVSPITSQITATVPAVATTGPVKVTNNIGTGISTQAFTVTAQQVPSIQSFTPASGPVGTIVTIRGQNLRTTTLVTFNGISASFTVTGNDLVVSVPPGATTGRIRVTTPGGTAISATDFTVGTSGGFNTPTITSISPSTGQVGTTVLVTGTNFQPGVTVKFNGVASTSVTPAPPPNTGLQLTAVVPPTATTGPVIVDNGLFGGPSAPGPVFTVIPVDPGPTPPTVDLFAPESGSAGDEVVLTGTGFATATSVKLDGISMSFTIDDATHITATVPDGATTGTFAVTNPGGTGFSTAAFNVEPSGGGEEELPRTYEDAIGLFDGPGLYDGGGGGGGAGGGGGGSGVVTVTVPEFDIGLLVDFQNAFLSDFEPVWTDLASFVLRNGVSYRRGRQQVLDQVEPGTAEFTLDNYAGLFEPDGIYGDLLMRHVLFVGKVRRTTTPVIQGLSANGSNDRVGGGDGFTYISLFDGVIESVAYDYPQHGKNGEARLRCYDGLGVAQRTQLTGGAKVETEQVGSRLAYLLTRAALPGVRNLELGYYVQGQQWGAATPALEAMRLPAASDGGNFYHARDGSWRFRSSQSAPVRDQRLIFAIEENANLFADVDLVIDEGLIYNTITISEADVAGGIDPVTGAITPIGWASQTFSDVASQTRYGLRTFELNTLLTSVDDARLRGEDLISRYPEPHRVITRLDISNLIEDYELILSLDLWDRVLVRATLPNGQLIEQESRIEGIEFNPPWKRDIQYAMWLSVMPFPELLSQTQQHLQGSVVGLIGWEAEDNCTVSLASEVCVDYMQHNAHTDSYFLHTFCYGQQPPGETGFGPFYYPPAYDGLESLALVPINPEVPTAPTVPPHTPFSIIGDMSIVTDGIVAIPPGGFLYQFSGWISAEPRFLFHEIDQSVVPWPGVANPQPAHLEIDWYVGGTKLSTSVGQSVDQVQRDPYPNTSSLGPPSTKFRKLVLSAKAPANADGAVLRVVSEDAMKYPHYFDHASFRREA